MVPSFERLVYVSAQGACLLISLLHVLLERQRYIVLSDFFVIFYDELFFFNMCFCMFIDVGLSDHLSPCEGP